MVSWPPASCGHLGPQECPSGQGGNLLPGQRLSVPPKRLSDTRVGISASGHVPPPQNVGLLSVMGMMIDHYLFGIFSMLLWYRLVMYL